MNRPFRIIQLEAVSNAIQETTNKRLINRDLVAILDRMRELQGMIELLEITQDAPSILYGIVMAMQENLSQMYKANFPSLNKVDY
jgi:hypothetical protein